MALVTNIRTYLDRLARQRRLTAELHTMSDAELKDLDLSYAQVTEMARREAVAA
jgi:uncharacterized protein YjiS (DUF1127 family)